MTMTMTITVDAQQYEDYDDCLAAAATDVADERDLHGWDLSARWADDDRNQIALDVPALCECGCGEHADTKVEMLLEEHRGTADALGWAEMSIQPMRDAMDVVDGHVPDGYIEPSDEAAQL